MASMTGGDAGLGLGPGWQPTPFSLRFFRPGPPVTAGGGLVRLEPPRYPDGPDAPLSVYADPLFVAFPGTFFLGSTPALELRPLEGLTTISGSWRPAPLPMTALGLLWISLPADFDPTVRTPLADLFAEGTWDMEEAAATIDLMGPQASSFEIDGSNLYLRADAPMRPRAGAFWRVAMAIEGHVACHIYTATGRVAAAQRPERPYTIDAGLPILPAPARFAGHGDLGPETIARLGEDPTIVSLLTERRPEAPEPQESASAAPVVLFDEPRAETAEPATNPATDTDFDRPEDDDLGPVSDYGSDRAPDMAPDATPDAALEITNQWLDPAGTARGAFSGSVTVTNTTGRDQDGFLVEIVLPAFTLSHMWSSGLTVTPVFDPAEGRAMLRPSDLPPGETAIGAGQAFTISFIARTTEPDALAALDAGQGALEHYLDADGGAQLTVRFGGGLGGEVPSPSVLRIQTAVAMDDSIAGFLVTREGADRPATVAWRVTDVDPLYFGGTLPSGILHFVTGEVQATLAVDLSGTRRGPNAVPFVVLLESPVNARVEVASARGAIPQALGIPPLQPSPDEALPDQTTPLNGAAAPAPSPAQTQAKDPQGARANGADQPGGYGWQTPSSSGYLGALSVRPVPKGQASPTPEATPPTRPAILDALAAEAQATAERGPEDAAPPAPKVYDFGPKDPGPKDPGAAAAEAEAEATPPNAVSPGAPSAPNPAGLPGGGYSVAYGAGTRKRAPKGPPPDQKSAVDRFLQGQGPVNIEFDFED